MLAPSAGVGDSVTATFYYPDTITGAAETNLKLQFIDASGNPQDVVSRGPLPPYQDFTDNPPSGESFTVTFDTTTSIPSITGLGGTIFTMAPAPFPASPSTLWPPDHKMVPVTVNAPGCTILSVSSNEPQTGLGNGDVGPDWQITGALTVNLRAERSNAKGGRIYSILLQCGDGTQNIAVVRAPHDKSKP